ncbi:CTD small phosphatase-like protein 3 isoform X1 [Poeciliopsis prolifica]|uniref:CTD small phosphatase-like protein 3 isoform X1 n=1 Tax=Poeciliopsis prolifica TaxID=188132 RepID=UPI002413C800|nr:CTD small phosphatase-like protein 3 isoform X1 [Poeciliopsis prolifica]
MRLRSQRTIAAASETPRRTRQRSRQTRLSTTETENPSPNKVEEESVVHQQEDEVPTVKRRPLPRGRARKRPRAIAVEDREPGVLSPSADLAFKTPLKPIMHHERILSEIDVASPRNSTARNIYPPIVRFLTPSKENVKCPETANSVLLSPEQGVFGYGSIDLLAGDEDDDVFDPFTFIKNIPSQSQHSRPCLQDIPPKTRSTPEATLVVDLEETLMFSSLNVIEEADYTFYTTFQDHQYKVYMILRPHVREFLQAMAKIYELFVYTCAKKEYAEKILEVLDPQKKLFRHRLYQDDCACVLGHYIKDLSILGRDLTKTVVLDNAPHTYPYHLMNTIPIKSWSGGSEDKELQKLVSYMERLAPAEDFQEVLKKRKDHFHRFQIGPPDRKVVCPCREPGRFSCGSP